MRMPLHSGAGHSGLFINYKPKKVACNLLIILFADFNTDIGREVSAPPVGRRKTRRLDGRQIGDSKSGFKVWYPKQRES
jgi:hypothetical protein